MNAISKNPFPLILAALLVLMGCLFSNSGKKDKGERPALKYDLPAYITDFDSVRIHVINLDGDTLALIWSGPLSSIEELDAADINDLEIDTQRLLVSGYRKGDLVSSTRIRFDEEGAFSIDTLLADPQLSAGPIKPFSPVPVSGSMDRMATLDLQWKSGHREYLSVTYDIFLGTDSSNLPLLATQKDRTRFEVKGLEQGQQFFWKVVASDDEQTVSSLIWTFTTAMAAPADLVYSNIPPSFVLALPISPLTPSNTGGPILDYSVKPSLPPGLSIKGQSGIISGTPSSVLQKQAYTVLGSNPTGFTRFVMQLQVIPELLPPYNLTYLTPVTYTLGDAIQANIPANSGGRVYTYSVSPPLPRGLLLDSNTGVITGTPEETSNAAHYVVTGTNPKGKAEAGLDLAVVTEILPPDSLAYFRNPATYVVDEIITPNIAYLQGGAPDSFTIKPALPDGLLFNTRTGSVTGLPTKAAPASTHRVTAINSAGSAHTDLVVEVMPELDPPKNLTYSLSASVFETGASIDPLYPNWDGGPIDTFDIEPNLPLGLQMNNVTGVISGVPRQPTNNTSYLIEGVNRSGKATVEITIQIVPGLEPPANLQYSYSQATFQMQKAIEPNEASYGGGTAQTFWTEPSLPEGLSINRDNGRITGTPAAVSPRTLYTVFASNSAGNAQASLSFEVELAPPRDLNYSSTTLSLEAGRSISPLFPTVAGGPVASFSVSPTLPEGLNLDPVTGKLDGVPTKASSRRTYTIRASNEAGAATFNLSIEVILKPPADLKYSANPAQYLLGKTITPNLPQYEGGPIDKYSVTPALPAGLVLNAKTGAIEGTPTELLPSKEFTITAENTSGSTTVKLELSVVKELTAPSNLTYSKSAPTYVTGVEIAPNTPSQDGGAPESFSITPSLPAGLQLDPGTGVLTGTPLQGLAQTEYIVTAKNAAGSSTAKLQIAVNYNVPVLRFQITSGKGNEFDDTVHIPVVLSEPAYRQVKVDYVKKSGSASTNRDFKFPASVQTLVFNPGETSKSIALVILNDKLDENEENLTIALRSVDKGALGPDSLFHFSIVDDDAEPEISISVSDESISEKDGSTTITVSLSGPSGKDVQATLGFSGSATLNSDYKVGTTQLTIAEGKTSATTTLSALYESAMEQTEEVIIKVASASNASIKKNDSAKVRIIDFNPLPEVGIVQRQQGHSEGAGTIEIRLSLAKSYHEEVIVRITTSGDADSGKDYTLSKSEFVFSPGQTLIKTYISIIDDNLREPTEAAYFHLVGVKNASIGNDRFALLIYDNDFPPVLSWNLNPTSVIEADTTVNLGLSLNFPAPEPVSVDWKVSSTEAGPGDFVAASGTLNFSIGQQHKTIPVTIKEDNVVDGKKFEILVIELSNPKSLTIDRPTYELAIEDDDFVIPDVTLSLTPTAINENGGTAALKIVLSQMTTVPVTVDLDLPGRKIGTGPGRYTAPTDRIVFSPGKKDTSLTLTAVDNSSYTGNVTFDLAVLNVINGKKGNPSQRTLTIEEDELQPATVKVSLSPTSIEDDGGTAQLTVTRQSGTAPVTVVFDLPRLGTLYSSDASELILPSGTTTKSLTLTGIDRSGYQGDTAVTLKAQTIPAGSLTGDSEFLLTIKETTPPPPSKPSVTLSVSKSSVTEAEGSFWIRATLSNAFNDTVRANLSFSGTANKGGDYSVPAEFIKVKPGSTVDSLLVNLASDNTDEADETINISISTVGNGTVGSPSSSTVTLVDSDPAPSITGFSPATDKTNEQGGQRQFTIGMNRKSSRNVTVFLAYSGTADNSDYTGQPASVTIPAGSQQESFNLTIVDDNKPEGEETIIIAVDSAVNAVWGSASSATVTIEDDDMPTLTLGVSPSTISEDGGISTITATLSAPAVSPVTVNLGFTGASGEYVASSNKIEIAVGSISGTATITGIPDTQFEGDDAVTVSVLSVMNAHEATPQVKTIILLDNDLPTVSLGLSASSMPETGGSAMLTATLSGGNTALQDVAITLAYSGSATRGVDYTAADGLTILKGDASASIPITASPDTEYELQETIVVGISDAGGLVASPTTVTLALNDDDLPEINTELNPTSISEAGGSATFKAKLPGTQTALTNITMNLILSGSTASVSAPSSITIASGQNSGSVTVTAIDDNTYQGNRTVNLSVANVQGAVDNSPQTHTLTIMEDDSQPLPVATLSSSTNTLSEAGPALTVTVNLSSPATSELTVSLGYSSGTAVRGTDYNAPLSVTIPKDASAGSFSINPIDDPIYEGSESFNVSLSTPATGYAVGTPGSLNLTIEDNDLPPLPVATLSSETNSLSEGGPALTVTVNLSSPATSELTVNLGYSSGTAVRGTDYNAPLSVTISSGTSQSFSISPIEDLIYEGSETFTVSLSTPASGYTAGAPGSLNLTIEDNESLPVATITTASSSFSEDGGTLEFLVSLDKASSASTQIGLAYSGPATRGTDYSAPVSVSIPAGAKSATGTLTGIPDELVEGDDTITVGIEDGTGYTRGTPDNISGLMLTDVPPPPQPPTLPVVSFAFDDASLIEGNSTNFRFTLDKVSASDVVVFFTLGGTADSGGMPHSANGDYQILPSMSVVHKPSGAYSITIPKDSLSAVFSIEAFSVEPSDKTVEITPTSATGADLASTSTASLTIFTSP